MKVTHSFEELISLLSQLDKNHYKEVLENFEYDLNEINAYACWDDDIYMRHGIVKTDDFELILMCWNVEQQTPIHCHNGKDCWMRILQGRIEETVFERHHNDGLHLVKSQVYVAGNLAHVNDRLGVHRLKNVGGEKAISLHLYAKPIEQCSVYDTQTNDFKIKTMCYDSYKGKMIEKL